MIEDRAVKNTPTTPRRCTAACCACPPRRMWLSIPTSRRVPAQSAVLRLCAFPSVSGIWVVLPELSGAPGTERRYRMDRRSCPLIRLGQKHRPPNRPHRPEKLRLTAALPVAVKTIGAEIAARRGRKKLLGDMEIPLAGVLADMERIGFLVDGPAIAEFGRVLQARIDDVQRQITDAVGYSFNLNSPKQLGKALFEDLGLPAKKKRPNPAIPPTPRCSRSLREAHPVGWGCCWITVCLPSSVPPIAKGC